MVDGTPSALIIPTLFTDFLQASEDYYERFYFANVTRALRILAFVISLLGPSLYVALTTFHQEMLPTPLLLTFSAAKSGVPFPTFIEALIMEIAFELLREAGIRLPRTVGQAISIVGALIIGEAAVQSGIVSRPMVIVVATTGIASFAIPAFNAAIAFRIMRFPIMFIAAATGVFGIAICSLMLILHVSSLRSFGAPLLSPVAPMHWKSWLSNIFVVPYQVRKWRDSPAALPECQKSQLDEFRKVRSNVMLFDRRFAAYAFICLCLLTLLSSCSTDIRELNQVSIVMATGIDWDQDTKKHRITVYTLQPTSKGTNATQQDSLNEWFASATGESIMESAQHLRYRASKKLFWFHNRIFIISREAARHSLPEIIDFLQRNREIRSTSLVLISDVNADRVLKTKPETKDLVVNELFGLIRNQDETGKSLGISVKDLINKNANTTQRYITGRVVTRTTREKSEPVLPLYGSALLQKGTFVNWLSSDETAIVRLMTDPDTDKVQATFVVKDQDYNFDSITAQVAIKSRKIRSYFVGDLNFGNHLYQHHPNKWKQIQPKWNAVFEKMPVHVTVNLTIGNTGNVQ